MSDDVVDRVAGAPTARAAVLRTSAAPLLDAKGAAALLNVPATWVLAEARAARIPHVRLHMPPDAITADHIDAYKEKLLAGWRRERATDGSYAWAEQAEGPLSNRTIVRHLVVLNGIFKRAKCKGWITDNPASGEMVERPPVIYTGEFDTYTRDEVELLAAHARNSQDAAIYRTAAYTGLRQGELLALQWRDVNFVTGLVHAENADVARPQLGGRALDQADESPLGGLVPAPSAAPRPCATALGGVRREQRVAGFGYARDTPAADGATEERADTAFPCKPSTRGGTRTRTAAKGQWLLRPSCLTNSTTRAGRLT